MITFQKATVDLLSLLPTWYEGDIEANKRISFYRDPSIYWKLIQTNNNRFGWIAFNSEVPIGLFDMEMVGYKKGSIAFLIEKNYRGKGLGKEMIKEALTLPEVKDLQEIDAFVEEDNTVSLAILHSTGFVKNGYDKDGLVRMTRQL